MDAAKPVAVKFWEAVNEIPFLGELGAKMKTVAAQPVVLKALAKLTYDFAFGRSKNDKHLKNLLARIPTFDYSHKNPMWRYYQLSGSEIKEHGLEPLKKYLPADDEGYNRDIGGYDQKTEVIRFGAKHNDIFPILGDMVRFMAGLPSRHSEISEEVEAR